MKIKLEMEVRCSECEDALEVWVDDTLRGSYAAKPLVVELCSRCKDELEKKSEELASKVEELEKKIEQMEGGSDDH
ncbi:MAG: hypothetical protein WC789_06830 [Lentisphaeria bacterium]